MVNLDADGLEVGVCLERVVDTFTAGPRLLATSEGHIQTANQPAILPNRSDLNQNFFKCDSWFPSFWQPLFPTSLPICIHCTLSQFNIGTVPG